MRTEMQGLFERDEIGDRTPSLFLRHMTLAGESVTDEFFKTMWLSRLQAVRTVTSARDVLLDQLAADKINDTMLKAAALCANIDRTEENVLQIATTPRDPEKDELRQELRSQMTEVMKTFARYGRHREPDRRADNGEGRSRHLGISAESPILGIPDEIPIYRNFIK